MIQIKPLEYDISFLQIKKPHVFIQKFKLKTTKCVPLLKINYVVKY